MNLDRIQIRGVRVAEQMAESSQLVQFRRRLLRQKGRPHAPDVELHSPDQIRVIPAVVDAVLEEPCNFLEQLLERPVEVVELVAHAVHVRSYSPIEHLPAFRNAIHDSIDVAAARSQGSLENRERSLIHTL